MHINQKQKNKQRNKSRKSSQMRENIKSQINGSGTCKQYAQPTKRNRIPVPVSLPA